ncbi:MAG TPA: twin-arginine translocation signal domain-containing protein, partial [Jiangellaceae bacterium]|nr:twin-arginine translocation signal domain-containing protein [Jiangellaceae bacterium]
MSRRSFIARSGLVAAGAGVVGLAGCTTGNADQAPADNDSTRSAPVDLSDWAAIRAQFALDPEISHFAAFVLASHPAQVRDAINQFRDSLDRDPVAATGQEIQLENAVRAAAARYLGVAAEEVAL